MAEENDFLEIDGREQYYTRKEQEVNHVADLLSGVRDGLKDMQNTVKTSAKGAVATQNAIKAAEARLKAKTAMFDKAALFLNAQPKRQLAGGENFRLEIKKLKLNIATLEDTVKDYKLENEELTIAKQELEAQLEARLLAFEIEKGNIKAQALRAFFIAEFAAQSKADMETLQEFWQIWRSEFIKEKISSFLFEIKNQAVTIDKLRKHKRVKTKATLEMMKKIQNRVIKDHYFQQLKEYANDRLIQAYQEKKEAEIRLLNTQVTDRDLKIIEMQKMIDILEVAQADNNKMRELIEGLQNEKRDLELQVNELEEDYEELESELKGVRKEYDLFRKEVEKDKADGTDYKKLSQRYAKLFQKEQTQRINYQTKLHILATPDEMEKLIRQDEYEKICERLGDYDSMFEYLRQEMSNAENYRTQIQELKLVLKDANKQMAKMADIKAKNQRLQEAIGIHESEGPQGFIDRWLKAVEEVNRVRLESRRRLEEIESLRRQKEIFKLNYQSEVASHITTCYRALQTTATIDEKDVLTNLEDPKFRDGQLNLLEKEHEDLKQWLCDFVEKEEGFLAERYKNKAELDKLHEDIYGRTLTPSIYLRQYDAGLNKDHSLVKLTGNGKIQLPPRTRNKSAGGNGASKILPFDPNNSFYRGTGNDKTPSYFTQQPQRRSLKSRGRKSDEQMSYSHSSGLLRKKSRSPSPPGSAEKRLRAMATIGANKDETQALLDVDLYPVPGASSKRKTYAEIRKETQNMSIRDGGINVFLTDDPYKHSIDDETADQAFYKKYQMSGFGGSLDGCAIDPDTGSFIRRETHGVLKNFYEDHRGFAPLVNRNESIRLDMNKEIKQLHKAAMNHPRTKRELDGQYIEEVTKAVEDERFIQHVQDTNARQNSDIVPLSGIRLFGVFDDDDPVADLKDIPMDARMAAALGTDDPAEIRQKMNEIQERKHIQNLANATGSKGSVAVPGSGGMPLHSSGSQSTMDIGAGGGDMKKSSAGKNRRKRLTARLVAEEAAEEEEARRKAEAEADLQRKIESARKPPKPRVGDLDAEGMPIEVPMPKPVSKMTMNPYAIDSDEEELDLEKVQKEFPRYEEDMNADQVILQKHLDQQTKAFKKTTEAYKATSVLRKFYIGKMWKP